VAFVDGTGGSTKRGAALSRDRPALRREMDDRRFRAREEEGPGAVRAEAFGPYVATDFHAAGGPPQVLKMLLTHGVCTANATITGRTLAEELANVPEERAWART